MAHPNDRDHNGNCTVCGRPLTEPYVRINKEICRHKDNAYCHEKKGRFRPVPPPPSDRGTPAVPPAT
jgi:hypothetical protein